MKISDRIIFLAAATFLLLITNASAIRMTSTKIAYVDIERVYRESRGVEASRMELEQLIKDRKKKIRDAEKAVEGVRKNLKKNKPLSPEIQKPKPFESQLSTAAAFASDLSSASASGLTPELPPDYETVSSTAVPADNMPAVKKPSLPDFEIREMNDSLLETEKLIEDLMLESRELIAKKENELRIRLMAKIYDAIKKIALEEGFSIIVDKEVLFYSEEAVEDITDRVIRSINEE